jgi:hypothetical protein
VDKQKEEESPREEAMDSEKDIEELRRSIRDKMDQLNRAFWTGQWKITPEVLDMIKKTLAGGQAREARDRGNGRSGPGLARVTRRADNNAQEGVYTPTSRTDSDRNDGSPRMGEWSCATVQDKRVERIHADKVPDMDPDPDPDRVHTARIFSPWRATRGHPPAAESSQGVVCWLRRATRSHPPAVESSQGPSAGCTEQ